MRLKCIDISSTQSLKFKENIDRYNQINQYSPTSPIRIQSVFSGTNPHSRLATNSYVLTMLPIPNIMNTYNGISSPFDFYKKKSDFSKKINKISTLKWFNDFFRTLLTLMNNKEFINIPRFPDLDEKKQDKDEIKKCIYNWMTEVINTPQSILENKTKKIENQSIIKKVDEDFQIKEEENFDPSKLYCFLNFKQKNKEKVQPFIIKLPPDEEDKVIFFEHFDNLISTFIHMRTSDLKSLAKISIKNKLIEDMKKVFKIILTANKFNIIESLNCINIQNCLIRPNTNKENVPYDFPPDNDIEEIDISNENEIENDE